MLRFWKVVLFVILASWNVESVLAAQKSFEIDTAVSKLMCSVKYTVIGKYKAEFVDFSGDFFFDEINIENSWVNAEFNTESLKSSHPKLDKIVRSKRILNSQKYPKVFFRSQRIIQDGTGYQVEGELDLHGVQKSITFPFEFSDIQLDEQGRQYVQAKGIWRIPRKDFGIRWSKILDHGGILVGNIITVDWQVRAYR